MPRFHIQVLQSELTRRKLKNSRYSLRAFAAQLEMHPSALSRILAGKQELSLQGALSVIEKLSMTEQEKHQFVASVAQEKYQQALATLAPAIGPKAEINSIPNPKRRQLLLETALSFSPDRILILDRDGRCLVTSPKATPATVSVPEEPPGQTAREAGLAPDLTAQIETQTSQVLATGDASSIEFTVIEQGRTEYFRRIATAIRADDGGVEAVLVHIRQITAERKATARAAMLQELTEALSRALDRGQVARAVVTRLRTVMPCDVLGVRTLEGKYLHLLDGIPDPATHPIPRIDLEQDPSSAHSVAIRTAQPRWAGDVVGLDDLHPTAEFSRHLNLSAGVVIPLMANNRPIGTLGLGYKGQLIVSEEDHTFLMTLAAVCAHALERARLYEEEYRKRLLAERGSTKFRTLIDSLSTICFCITADGTMDYCNPAFCEWLGFDPLAPQRPANWWHECVDVNDIAPLAHEFKTGLSSGSEFTLITRVRRHDGQFRWVRVDYTPARDPNRAIVAWIGSIVEIHDQISGC